jgi:hypothetical protein
VLIAAGCASDEPTIQLPPGGAPTATAGSSPTAPQSPSQSVTISQPGDGTEVKGNVVDLVVAAQGVGIKPADGDKSGATGHFHVYVDKEPPTAGETIPQAAGIVHSPETNIAVTGLSVGRHKLTVVLGNGAHERIGIASDSVEVDVKGPSVKATAPGTSKAGQPVKVEMKAEGIEIVKADGNPQKGHFHVFVDPASPPKADGKPIPTGDPKIIHTADTSTSIADLPAGSHTLWVVVGDGRHVPLDPLVADKVTVVVQ